MSAASPHDPARDPQDLERLLVTRQRTGDVEGMMALYEPHAVVDCGTVAAGWKFGVGEQRVLGFNPGTVISGELALTSTRLPDGTVTAEAARRRARRHLALGHRQVLQRLAHRPAGLSRARMPLVRA